MTRFLLSALLGSCAVFAQTGTPNSKAVVAASKPDPKTAPVKRNPDGRPLGVPDAAVKIAEGSWRVVENGKPVIYRSGAFGFVKLSEEDYGRLDHTQTASAVRPDPKGAPVKRHPDGRPLGVPFAAVKIADGAWRIVENGKPVVYRSTAFGYSKVTEEENGKIQRMIGGNPDAPLEIPEGLTVAEEGGKLRFSRNTPFGAYMYVKDMSELTAMEKALWEKTTQAKGAPKN